MAPEEIQVGGYYVVGWLSIPERAIVRLDSFRPRGAKYAATCIAVLDDDNGFRAGDEVFLGNPGSFKRIATPEEIMRAVL